MANTQLQGVCNNHEHHTVFSLVAVSHQIYLPQDDFVAKLVAKLQCENFSIDFKDLIGVASAILGKIDREQYFEGTKKEFFEGKQIISTLLVFIDNRSGCYGRPINLYIIC